MRWFTPYHIVSTISAGWVMFEGVAFISAVAKGRLADSGDPEWLVARLFSIYIHVRRSEMCGYGGSRAAPCGLPVCRNVLSCPSPPQRSAPCARIGAVGKKNIPKGGIVVSHFSAVFLLFWSR